MVSAGDGTTLGETWDVVAFRVSGITSEDPLASSYLTNVNSDEKPSGEKWIWIGTNLRTNWTDVSWSGKRLSTGQDAQYAAFACLGFH